MSLVAPMFLTIPAAWLTYRSDLAKYRRALRQHRLDFPPDDHDSGAGWAKNEENLDQWRRLIITQYLRAQADVLGIDLPEVSMPGMYGRVEWDDDPGEPYYLTDAGLRAARDRLRAEEKHRREVVGFWVTSLVSIIGALIGLVSVYKG